MAKPKQKIATMKELSTAIGISRPTLSRYFQDRSLVRESTARAIDAKLESVDYVYNFMATRQNRKSTGLIGVIIPHFTDLFFTRLLEAIEERARQLGYTIITQSSNGDPQRETQAIARLRSMSVDGAIISPLGSESSTEALRAAQGDFPIVFADSRPSSAISGTSFVGTDNKQSITAIVEYLCRTGAPPIFLRMPRLNSNAVERECNYIEAMKAHEHLPEFVEHTISPNTWEFEQFGFEVMDHHFARGNYTSASILCANDRIAIGAIRAAHDYGLFGASIDPSARLRIAGHDDHPLSRFMIPSVTTVAQDIDGIGYEAVRALSERILGEGDIASPDRLKQARLKIRNSA